MEAAYICGLQVEHKTEMVSMQSSGLKMVNKFREPRGCWFEFFGNNLKGLKLLQTTLVIKFSCVRSEYFQGVVGIASCTTIHSQIHPKTNVLKVATLTMFTKVCIHN